MGTKIEHKKLINPTLKELMAYAQNGWRIAATINLVRQTGETAAEAQPVTSGKLLYKVGLISDLHMDVEDSHNSEYREDLVNALNFFKSEDVIFIASCGDFCQGKDKDYESFGVTMNQEGYFAPLYTCMGNHDYQRIFQVRDAKHAVIDGYATAYDLWEKNVAKHNFEDETLNYFDPTTEKGRLSYWFQERDDIFVFMSVDYGQSTIYSDVIRGINYLDYKDKNVKRMTVYVSDTDYDCSREAKFDYQYYDPAVLMWLKNLLEANKSKRVFIFSHHFLPHKAGDTDGKYSRLRIWPEYTDDNNLSGSNTLSGLTFWFLNKLNNEYRNTIWFSGHSHRQWTHGISVCNHDFYVKQPTGRETIPPVNTNWTQYEGTDYDYRLYTRLSDEPIKGSAPWIGLPSLAKPTDGTTVDYQGSQGAIMEVYDDKVILKEIVFKTGGSSMYNNTIVGQEVLTAGEDPATVPAKPQGTPEADYIEFVIHNATTDTVRFSNKFNMMVTQGDCTQWSSDNSREKEMPCHIGGYDTATGGYAHWYTNPNVLAPNETKTVRLTEFVRYDGTGIDGKVNTVKLPLSTFCDGTWKFMTVDKYSGTARLGVAVKLGVAVRSTKDGSVSNTAFSVHVAPLPIYEAIVEKGMTYHLYIDSFKRSGSDWTIV